ncbi:MAG: HEAT repeat domain-containing protein [Thermoguttaceae bacterium]|nr:HEAT repeat domain-containing protein [Thermoguttaceae bacterium]MDW8078130.1 HEAT repeat domain-containing protein [Thermoguttaceae bacterium]
MVEGHRFHRLLAVLMILETVFLFAGTQLAAQQNIYRAEEEPQLIAVLKSAEAPLFEKAMACKKLAVIGTARAIEVLGQLLSDPQLSHYARFALEPIPSPEVDRVLREAAGRLEGRLLVGVLDSIGNRRDAEAVPLLEKLLESGNEEVVEAAAIALGRIGTPAAAQRLEVAMKSPQIVKRESAARGALIAAERLAAGQPLIALGLYEAIWRADVPANIRMAGLRGVILQRGETGVALLLEQLRSQDEEAFRTALGAAREIPETAGLTEKLVGLMGELPPPRQAKLLSVLADRGNPAARPAVLGALKNPDQEVRLAAVRALGKLGDASAVPALLEVASGADATLAEAAQTVLASLPGREIDEAIVAELGAGSQARQVVAMRLAAQRYIHAAVPRLRKALEAPEAEIRMAAIHALGYTTKLEDLPVLTGRLLTTSNAAERAALEEALRAACPRIPEREACAGHLVEVLEKAPADVKPVIMRLLGVVGGKTALETLVKKCREGDEATRDVATQVLGEWMGTDAAPALLELAKSDLPERFRIRALRGYIRIVRQFDLSDSERVAMSRQALAVATRDAERRLVVELLGRVITSESLELLLSLLDDPQIGQDAQQAAVTVCEKLVASQPAVVREAAQKILERSKDPEVQKRAKAVLKRAR